VSVQTKRAWLFAMSLDSLGVSEKENLLGADDRAKKNVPRIAKGDVALIYVGKTTGKDTSASGRVRAFRALFEVTGPSFQGDSPLWPLAGVFPYRIPARLSRRLDVPMDKVKGELSFTNVSNYGLFLLNAPQEIPLEDIEAVLRADAARAGSPIGVSSRTR
jgi:hypothetical protein